MDFFIQANQTGSSTGMELAGAQACFDFIL